jgi:hypothetical protein
MISASLAAAGFAPGPGSPELNRARRSGYALLRMVRRCNRMKFWDLLTIPRAQKSQVLETMRDQRSELLAAAHDQLQGEKVTRADILVAIDGLHQVVTSMNTMFAMGKVTDQDCLEDSWALDRYACAALLPRLAAELDLFWAQLRKNSERKGVEE